MTQKILASIFLIVVVVSAGILISKSRNSASNNEIINPVPPNPIVPGPGKIAAGYVSGHITIGPFCPVERVDEPCKVPPEAYTSREAVVYGSNGTTIKERVHLDAEGNYKIALAPGNYFIQIQPAGIGPGEKKYVTVKSFETAVVNFDIDTGIR